MFIPILNGLLTKNRTSVHLIVNMNILFCGWKVSVLTTARVDELTLCCPPGFHEKDGKAFCRKDYFDMFAPKCGGCARAILENYISALNSLWHPECFVCRVSG